MKKKEPDKIADKNTDKVEITSVVVRIGKTEHNLSLEEARELKAVLCNLFDGYHVTTYPNAPVFLPLMEPFTAPKPHKWWEPSIVWCGTGVVPATAKYEITAASQTGGAPSV